MTKLSPGLGAWLAASLLAVSAPACKLEVDAEADADDLQELVDKAGKIRLCGGKTLAELGSLDKLGAACLKAIQPLLPPDETSFEGRLVLLGEQRHDSGERSLYLLGADASGAPLLTAPLGDLEVSITASGETRVLTEGEYSLGCSANGELLSLAVVNDYSASMADKDLALLSALETRLLNALPVGFEGETHLFSSEVQLRQPFTRERSELLQSVAVDAEYMRASTALLDGMGVALDRLLERDRPLKVLLVSTDGQENASKRYTQEQLEHTIEAEGVVVIMLGSLLSEPSSLRRLSGARGVFNYAHSYGALDQLSTPLIDSLDCVAELRLSAQVVASAELTITVAGQSLTVP